MRSVLLIVVLASGLFSQSPGTVTVNSATNVTAVASSVNCVLHKKSAEVATISCKVGSVVMTSGTMTLTPSTSTTMSNAVEGSCVNAGNNITWIVSQPMGQTLLSWQMAANGTQKSGTF